jgi:hypothetical protein
LFVTLSLVAIGAVTAAAIAVWRSSGAPGAPEDVRITATSCRTPCVEVDPQITLTWTGPRSGATVTGFRVFKDGSPLPGATDLGPSTTTLVDRDVELGEVSVYRVSALNGDRLSPSSEEVTGRPPRPPATLASLGGTYRVRIRVRHVRALGTVLGVKNPSRGKGRADRWTFLPTCGVQTMACPTRWERLPGRLRADDRTWRGTIRGPSARCGGGATVPAPIEMDLRSDRVGTSEGSWVVVRFSGRVRVSFRCPGFPASVGRVQVVGTRI